MKNQLEERLQLLESEYESGQKMLADLQNQERDVQETLLRISGAMQVIKELLQPDENENENEAVGDQL